MAISTNSLHILNDLDLVKRYAETDDKDCVGILYERYASLVYTVCLKYLGDKDESKDAAMLVFEKLLQDLKKHSIVNFKSWLHSVARNHCLMHLRKHKGISILGSDSGSLVTPVMEYKEYLHQEEEGKQELKLSELENALLELNEEQKICIELFYLKEKSYQEVADSTGFT